MTADRETLNLNPVDEGASRDNRILVAADEWAGDRLIVIPLRQVILDVAYIRTLQSATTVGEVRATPPAWQAAREAWVNNETDDHFDDDGNERNADDLVDDFPFSLTEWFGDEMYVYYLPLARLRTAETCPASILAQFGRKDTDVGMDYQPAPYFDPADQEAVETALTESGYQVVHNVELASGYSNY